jgi:hypothetical protein
LEGYGKISLNAVTSTGNLTQVYPSWNRYINDKGANVTVGDAIPIAAGGLLLRPEGGRIGQVSVETDGTDGGTIQLYDISGLDVGADVSSATTITNTQLTTGISAGKAKLLWEQNFAAAAGATIVYDWSAGFMRGIAARFVGTAGTCAISLKAEGGFSWRIVAGTYSGG